MMPMSSDPNDAPGKWLADHAAPIIAAPLSCATCDTPLPPGTRAKINADGVIVCVECAEALSDA